MGCYSVHLYGLSVSIDAFYQICLYAQFCTNPADIYDNVLCHILLHLAFKNRLLRSTETRILMKEVDDL